MTTTFTSIKTLNATVHYYCTQKVEIKKIKCVKISVHHSDSFFDLYLLDNRLKLSKTSYECELNKNSFT